MSEIPNINSQIRGLGDPELNVLLANDTEITPETETAQKIAARLGELAQFYAQNPGSDIAPDTKSLRPSTLIQVISQRLGGYIKPEDLRLSHEQTT